MSKKTRRLIRSTADDDDDGDFPWNIVLQYERESGTGSIIIVKVGAYEYYRARFWVTDELGVRRAKYVYGKSYAEAERLMAAKLRAPSNEIGGTTTVAAFMREWLRRVKSENRLGTFKLYESTFRNHVEPHIGKVKCKKLTAANVRALLAKLSEIGVGDRTRQNVRKVLHAAYEAALRDGLILRNPVALVRAPKAEYREQHVLSQDEANRLLDSATAEFEGHWYPLIRLALTSGMRQGELFALTVGDLRLNDEHPHLLVDGTLTEGEDGALIRTAPKTKASRRRVDLDDDTVTLLRARVDGLHASEYVFTTPSGSVLRKSLFLRRVFHPMVAAAGLPHVTFHSLRHVANTLLLATGAASHLDLAKRLGHSTPRMTLERYARVIPGAQAGLAVKAAALFDRGAKRACGANDGATTFEKTSTR